MDKYIKVKSDVSLVRDVDFEACCKKQIQACHHDMA